MSELITLENLDADGAIQEAAYAVDPEGAATRADFFKKAAIGGGGLVAGGVVFAGLPGARARRAVEVAGRRDPQLRADARVPRDGVLQGGPRQGRPPR